MKDTKGTVIPAAPRWAVVFGKIVHPPGRMNLYIAHLVGWHCFPVERDHPDDYPKMCADPIFADTFGGYARQQYESERLLAVMPIESLPHELRDKLAAVSMKDFSEHGKRMLLDGDSIDISELSLSVDLSDDD